MDFYASRVDRLTREMDNERPHAYRLKLGIAFIMFEHREMALAVLSDLNPGAFGSVKREAHRANALLPLLERVNEYRAPGTEQVHSDACCQSVCCSRWYGSCLSLLLSSASRMYLCIMCQMFTYKMFTY